MSEPLWEVLFSPSPVIVVTHSLLYLALFPGAEAPSSKITDPDTLDFNLFTGFQGRTWQLCKGL